MGYHTVHTWGSTPSVNGKTLCDTLQATHRGISCDSRRPVEPCAMMLPSRSMQPFKTAAIPDRHARYQHRLLGVLDHSSLVAHGRHPHFTTMLLLRTWHCGHRPWSNVPHRKLQSLAVEPRPFVAIFFFFLSFLAFFCLWFPPPLVSSNFQKPGCMRALPCGLSLFIKLFIGRAA